MGSCFNRAEMYRAKAEECLRLAHVATSPTLKAQYMDLAAHWHMLATGNGTDTSTVDPAETPRSELGEPSVRSQT